jgi:ComF family protein
VTVKRRSFTESILDLLFPDRCVGCGRFQSLLCPSCVAKLRPGSHNGRLRTGNHIYAPLLDDALVAFVFESPLREAIHALKYQRKRRIAVLLGDLLATYLRSHPLPTHVDALIPVPLHPRRLTERGFNQSELLAQRLAQLSGIPLLTVGLVRSRDTRQQVGLDAHERHENVKGAFSWQRRKPPPARVLLIDDVLTTGATMDACAYALRAAGAHEIYALALASG